MKNGKGFTLIEVLCVGLALALALAVAPPVNLTKDDLSKITACAMNMRAISQAMHTYAEENDGDFPALGQVRKKNDGEMRLFSKRKRAEPLTKKSKPSPAVDLWAMVRDKRLMPKQFICPCTKDVPDPAQNVAAYYNFLKPRNLSYGYQYQYDPDFGQLSTRSSPVQPVLADANPYVKGGVKREIAADRISKTRGNSTNHKDRYGQNVLRLNGYFECERGPDSGTPGRISAAVRRIDYRGRDNIYTVHASSRGAIVDPGLAAPTWKTCNLGSKSDTCLVP